MKFFKCNNINKQQLFTLLFILSLASSNSSTDANTDGFIVETNAHSLGEAGQMVWWWQLMLNQQRGYLIDNSYNSNLAFAAFKIDLDFIKTRIMGKATYREKLANLIWQARAQSTQVKNYIDLVLQYMPEFRVRPATVKFLRTVLNNNNTRAIFNPAYKEVLLPIDEANDALIITHIAHEFDHAFRVLVHEILGDKAILHPPVPYFPDTEQEKQKYQKLWDDCDTRMSDIRIALKQQALGNLGEQKKLELNKYKAAVAELMTYQMQLDFNWEETLPFSENFVQQCAQAGIHFKVGQTYNIDKYTTTLPAFGSFKVIKVQQEQGIFNITVKYQDPLILLITIHGRITGSIKQQYAQDRILSERNAFLRQFFPEEIIKIIYADIYQYDIGLRKNVSMKATTNSALMQCIYDEFCRYKNLANMFSIHLSDNQVTATNADLYIVHADHLMRSNQLAEAEAILLEVNKTGLQPARSNSLLGQIYFYQNNYQLAVTHFKRAYKKAPKELSRFVFYTYGISLLRTEYYKDAEKMLKKACDMMQLDPDAEDELFTLCQQSLLEARNKMKQPGKEIEETPRLRL